MIRKMLFAVAVCLMTTTAFSQYAIMVNNLSCMTVDLDYVTNNLGTCTWVTPGTVNAIPPGVSPFYIPNPGGIDPVVYFRLRETGNAANNTFFYPPGCGLPTGTFTQIAACSGLIHNAGVTVTGGIYTITIF